MMKEMYLPKQPLALDKDVGQVFEGGTGVVPGPGKQRPLQDAQPLRIVAHPFLLQPDARTERGLQSA